MGNSLGDPLCSLTCDKRIPTDAAVGKIGNFQGPFITDDDATHTHTHTEGDDDVTT
jgi:hypothetical protein